MFSYYAMVSALCVLLGIVVGWFTAYHYHVGWAKPKESTKEFKPPITRTSERAKPAGSMWGDIVPHIVMDDDPDFRLLVNKEVSLWKNRANQHLADNEVLRQTIREQATKIDKWSQARDATVELWNQESIEEDSRMAVGMTYAEQILRELL